jgi:dTDP-4-amino-4,6-dideoxygalactose transaminase
MKVVSEFESLVSEYFGAPYGIAVDCCTHGIELCLRLRDDDYVSCPTHTYLSVPMTFEKLNLNWNFKNKNWEEFYLIDNTNIIDAAVLWRENSYISGSFMVLSFQFKKHLNLGRGGMILTDDWKSVKKLKAMRYDGREYDTPWADQNIKTFGYHYYMTPEIAQLGIEKFEDVKNKPSKLWSWEDYPDLKNMEVFNEKFKRMG